MRIASIGSLPALLVLLAATATADDWPRWLGPDGQSVWRERSIVRRYPSNGLKVAWRTPVGLGYAGPAVAGGRVYLMDYQVASGEMKNNAGSRTRLQGKERVLCLDAGTGELLWKHEYERPYNISYPGGPRCTPTVADGRVIALGAEGNLWCLEADTGRVMWSVDFVKNYSAETPFWGVSAAPLVDGQRVFCMVGGPGQTVVCFDLKDGRELWKSLTASEPGYCAPTMIRHAGTQQLIIWDAQALSGLNPDSGKPYWSLPVKPKFGMAIAAPRKEGSLLLAAGYGETALVRLDDEKPAAEIVWQAKPKTGIFCACGTPFIDAGTIYGCDIESGALMGVRLEDGRRLWETFEPTMGGTRRARYGTAFLVKHEDRFFLFSETGDLILARLSPAGYKELDRFHVLEPTNYTFGRSVVWSHPAFAQRCVFARNDKEIVCVDLTEPK